MIQTNQSTKMVYTEEMLTQLCKELTEEYWNMGFDIPVVIGQLDCKTLAQFEATETEPYDIVFNESLIYNLELTEIIPLIKHELVHYANFMRGLPRNDWDDEFLQELARVDGGLYIDDRITTLKYGDEVHIVVCKNCMKNYAFFSSKQKYKEKANQRTYCCYAKPHYLWAKKILPPRKPQSEN